MTLKWTINISLTIFVLYYLLFVLWYYISLVGYQYSCQFTLTLRQAPTCPTVCPQSIVRQIGKGSLMNSKSTLCQGSPGACSVGRFWKVKVKCLYLYWTTLLFTQAALYRGPVVLGLVLLLEETEVPGGNRSTRRKPASLVQSIWTTLFSHLNKVTLIIYTCMESVSNPCHSGETHALPLC